GDLLQGELAVRLAAQAEDVRVVVTGGQRRAERVVAADRAHARDLVGDEAHRAAEAVHQHALVELLARHRLGDEEGDVRVVDGLGRVAAEVGDGVAQALEELLELLLGLEAAVVRADDDAHYFPTCASSCLSACGMTTWVTSMPLGTTAMPAAIAERTAPTSPVMLT